MNLHDMFLEFNILDILKNIHIHVFGKNVPQIEHFLYEPN
jgi:hypothetical protein